MSTPVISPPAGPPPLLRPRSRRILIAAVVAVFATVGALVGYAVVTGDHTHRVPDFPSLAANPDPSLHGTVAYVDDRTRCVNLVAAAGAPTKQLYCLPPMDVEQAKVLGKELGPQLRWRPDGLLEVTMFRMTDPPGPGFDPGWQRLVDPRTGAVTDVANPPSAVDVSGQPRVNAKGERIFTSFAGESGRVKISIRYPDGTTRVVLDARGGRNYTYHLQSAFWSPDGSWIAADDGRLLVIQPTDPSVVRVLVDQSQMGGFDGPRFAVTSTDLLATSKG